MDATRQWSSTRSDSTSSIASTRPASHLSLHIFLSLPVVRISVRLNALDQRAFDPLVPGKTRQAAEGSTCGGRAPFDLSSPSIAPRLLSGAVRSATRRQTRRVRAVGPGTGAPACDKAPLSSGPRARLRRSPDPRAPSRAEIRVHAPGGAVLVLTISASPARYMPTLLYITRAPHQLIEASHGASRCRGALQASERRRRAQIGLARHLTCRANHETGRDAPQRQAHICRGQAARQTRANIPVPLGSRAH